jgi:hypothetical protein
MFKKPLLFSALAGAASLGVLLIPGSGVASAAVVGPNMATPGSGYGFDGNSHLAVGGGSTTVYKIASGFAQLWDETEGCINNYSNNDADTANPQPYPLAAPGAYNQCNPTSQSYAGVEAGGNYDNDTIAVASPAGSGTGLASLNGDHGTTAGTYAYEGSDSNLATSGDPNGIPIGSSDVSSGFGTLDWSFSSRGPDLTGGNCTLSGPTGATNDELACDTFWGVAADGVDVFNWGASNAGDDNTAGDFSSLTTGFSPEDLYNIWTCVDTTWGQTTEWQTLNAAGDTNLPPQNAPIVPWSMNSNSGTYADFDGYVDHFNSAFKADNNETTYVNGGITWPNQSTSTPVVGPTPKTSGDCAREYADGSQPLENDVKPVLADVSNNQTYTSAGGTGEPTGGTTVGINDTDPYSTNNPANWVWFGSYGLLTAYPYLASPTLTEPNSYPAGPTSFTNSPVPVVNITTGAGSFLPSSSDIGGGTYPIERVLSVVTKKSDADCPVVSDACNFENFHADSVTLTNGSATFADASATTADDNTELYSSGTTGFPAPVTVESVSSGTVTMSAAFTGTTGTYTVDFGSSATAVGPLNDNGTVDLNVEGASSGKGGAVREFVRFLCRTKAQNTDGSISQPTDAYTGASEYSEIQTVISGSGFTLTPTTDAQYPNDVRTKGTNCDVQSYG